MDIDDNKYAKKNKKGLSFQFWVILAVVGVAIGGIFFRVNHQITAIKETAKIENAYLSTNYSAQVKDLQSKLDAATKLIDKLNEGKESARPKNKLSADSGPTTIWDTLPTSDVWCKGDKRENRVCKFRNLCYLPQEKQWIFSKTRRSIIDNVPNGTSDSLLELSTIEGHSLFFWDYTEISPFAEKFRNRAVRYETVPHFLFARLHPQNIMHNIHDDFIGMYYLIKQVMGGGHEEFKMPFYLDTHRILVLDAYGFTDTSRPLQYLSSFPIRFQKDFLWKEKDTITCFRDAIVGSTKIATFYQYGWQEPQGPIKDKELNGMYIREVVEWILRRIQVPIAFDEEPFKVKNVQDKSKYFGTKLSALDLKETDLIIILTRKKDRLILNQNELAEALTQKYGLETILMGNEDHTFEEQIKKLRRARVVLAMHGSILIMTMFCRRGTVIIEMFPFAVPSENYTPYKTLANLPGMDLTYRAWENPDESASVGHPHKHELHGGLDHLSEEERQKVLNTKTVPPHKCCSSPYWLYRIYQDTVVNIKQVLEIIDQALEDSRTKTLSVLYEKNWEETDNLMPSTALNIKCVDESQRQEGYLWLEWDSPWNGIEAEDWHVFVSTTHQDFLTNSSRTSIYIPGFKTNTTVRVFYKTDKK